MNTLPITTRLSLAFALLVPACGGASSAFSPTFADNQPDDVGAVMARLSQAQAATDLPVIAGITQDGELFAYDVQGSRLLFHTAAHARGAPIVAGHFVALQEASNEVVIRDLATGQEVTRIEDDALYLTGAAAEGDRVAIVLSTTGGVGAHSHIILFENGSKDWDLDVNQAVGSPAMAASMLFVPWASQNVSVLDASNGHELARIRMTDEIVGHAIYQDGEMYFAQTGVFRLTPTIVRGSREQSAFIRPTLSELPGHPMFLPDAYQPPAVPQSATYRVTQAWRATAHGDRVAFDHNAVYLLFYKLAFALEAETGAIRWATHTPVDAVGAEATSHGLLLVTEDGHLSLFDAEGGATAWEGSMPVRPVVATLRLGNFSPPSSNAMAPEAALRDQLLAAAQNNDARLVPARVFAIHQLAALPEAEVTGHLIALCDMQEAPRQVHAASCGALVQRSAGNQYVLEALGRHAAFLQGTRPPPVGALAKAAVRMQERASVPLLLSHLRDPETPAEDLAAIVQAVRELGDRDAAAPLSDFLLLYHAETSEADQIGASLGLAVDTLVALVGPVAEDTLQVVAKDPASIPDLRARAQEAINALAAESQTAEQADTRAQAAQQAEAQATSGDEALDENPDHLTSAHVQRALAGVGNQLKACLRNDASHPATGRVLIGVTADGVVDLVSVSPTSMQECVAPLVRPAQFPRNTRGAHEQVTYTITR